MAGNQLGCSFAWTNTDEQVEYVCSDTLHWSLSKCPSMHRFVKICSLLCLTLPACHCLLPVLATTMRYHDWEYARTVFFTENENKKSEVNLCSTVLPFILFYVLHFGCCSPLIPHTSQRHLFQVSASKGTGENKCVLRRRVRGHLRANRSRFLLGGLAVPGLWLQLCGVVGTQSQMWPRHLLVHKAAAVMWVQYTRPNKLYITALWNTPDELLSLVFAAANVWDHTCVIDDGGVRQEHHCSLAESDEKYQHLVNIQSTAVK